MLFVLSKLFGAAMMPLGASLILLIAGLLLKIFKQKKKAIIAYLLAGGYLYCCSLPFFANQLALVIEEQKVKSSELKNADGIVLLAGLAYQREHSQEVHVNERIERVLYALELYRLNKAPSILITGGSTVGLIPEAEVLKKMLVSFGMDENAIHIENKSLTTYENAKFSKEIMTKLGWQNIILVTSAFHMKRASRFFAMQNINHQIAPTDFMEILPPVDALQFFPNSAALDQSSALIKELVGYVFYTLFG